MLRDFRALRFVWVAFYKHYHFFPGVGVVVIVNKHFRFVKQQ